MSSTEYNCVDHRDIIFNATQVYGAAVRETCRAYRDLDPRIRDTDGGYLPIAGPDDYERVRTIESLEATALHELLVKVNQALNDTLRAGVSIGTRYDSGSRAPQEEMQ